MGIDLIDSYLILTISNLGFMGLNIDCRSFNTAQIQEPAFKHALTIITDQFINLQFQSQDAGLPFTGEHQEPERGKQ